LSEVTVGDGTPVSVVMGASVFGGQVATQQCNGTGTVMLGIRSQLTEVCCVPNGHMRQMFITLSRKQQINTPNSSCVNSVKGRMKQTNEAETRFTMKEF